MPTNIKFKILTNINWGTKADKNEKGMNAIHSKINWNSI
jgi:hypothetical protein